LYGDSHWADCFSFAQSLYVKKGSVVVLMIIHGVVDLFMVELNGAFITIDANVGMNMLEKGKSL
jgi:hypothetical protein